MFENAKWITRTPWIKWDFAKDPAELPPSPYLARTFTVKKPLKTATLHIVGLGQAAYYLNGARIPDSVRPTQPSAPIRTVVYNTYDLTALLHEGQNRLGVILGNNAYNDTGVPRWRSTTKMIAQLDIVYTDGERETLVSDTTWKTADSPTLFSLRRCGEKYDARLEIPDWCEVDFDDSNWDAAHITKGPGGALRPAICPPERVIRHIIGKEIAPGLFDFGENTSGWVHMTVTGKRGEELSIKYAERLTDDKQHANQCNILANIYKPMAHKDVYILNGEGEEQFEQLFSYHGFRYAEVEGNYDTVSLTAVVTYTDMPAVSDFHCDNQMINAIHNACVRSIVTNCHGAPVDCPHREQNEWTGDGMLSAEAISLGFDAYDMFYDWMLKFKDDQYPDGCLPCIIPVKEETWGYNFANGPDWDSAIFHIPYYCYKYTGDRRIVDVMWENMERSLKYFGTLSDTRLLNCGVGDWAQVGARCNREITDTAYYRMDALMMAEMAIATGRDPAPFLDLAEQIKHDFRAKHVKDGKVTDPHETALSAAIFAKMLDGEEVAAAAKQLADTITANGYRFVCGIHGLRMIFDALSENGYAQTVFDTVTNPAHPGYAHAIMSGLDTLPEDLNYATSLNHHFRSPVDTWFYKYLAGICVEGFGFDNIVIAPTFVDGVNTVKATLRGITVSYDEKTLSVNSPYPFTLKLNGICQPYPAGEYVFKR